MRFMNRIYCSQLSLQRILGINAVLHTDFFIQLHSSSLRTRDFLLSSLKLMPAQKCDLAAVILVKVFERGEVWSHCPALEKAWYLNAALVVLLIERKSG